MYSSCEHTEAILVFLVCLLFRDTYIKSIRPIRRPLPFSVSGILLRYSIICRVSFCLPEQKIVYMLRFCYARRDREIHNLLDGLNNKLPAGTQKTLVKIALLICGDAVFTASRLWPASFDWKDKNNK